MAHCNSFENIYPTDFSSIPLHTLIWEWLMKNTNASIDLPSLAAYFGVVLFAWLFVVWAIRWIMSIIWPVIVILFGVLVFKLFQCYEYNEVITIASKSFRILCDIMLQLIAKFLELALQFFDWCLN